MVASMTARNLLGLLGICSESARTSLGLSEEIVRAAEEARVLGWVQMEAMSPAVEGLRAKVRDQASLPSRFRWSGDSR